MIVADSDSALVLKHKVQHRGERLTISVPATAVYLGGQRFVLYGNADAEIHVFAEADEHRLIKRLFWVQFERYLPTYPERRYNYADNERVNLWGGTVWAGAGPRQSHVAGRPGSDRDHVMAIIAKAGYSVPEEMMSARLVRLLDDPKSSGTGRRELMLIYSEDLAPTGRHYADLVSDGRTTPAWEPLEQPLIARAAAAFEVSALP